MAEEKPRTWFGPIVLAGLASAALLAVVSARDWFVLGNDNKVGFPVADDKLRADMPLALGLALVVLAAWGVVLVTGRRVRRVMFALAALTTVGVLVCIVVAAFTLPEQIRAGLPGHGADNRADPTAAYVISSAAAPLVLGLVLVGWRLAPRWPTMSSRYDAPATRSPDPDEADLWKALDAGRDPTDPGSAGGP
ncbi:MAG TPA: Trp biosynthesis-associated membrane protein [Marmoricola sp.]|nr:Trp biosynthesis-associated membrane protein [Marmoricola sp.]